MFSFRLRRLIPAIAIAVLSPLSEAFSNDGETTAGSSLTASSDLVRCQELAQGHSSPAEALNAERVARFEQLQLRFRQTGRGGLLIRRHDGALELWQVDRMHRGPMPSEGTVQLETFGRRRLLDVRDMSEVVAFQETEPTPLLNSRILLSDGSGSFVQAVFIGRDGGIFVHHDGPYVVSGILRLESRMSQLFESDPLAVRPRPGNEPDPLWPAWLSRVLRGR